MLNSAHAAQADELPSGAGLLLPGTDLDAHVTVVANIKRQTYEQSWQTMNELFRAHGVTHLAYLEDEFFTAESDAHLTELLDSWHAQRNKVIDMVAASTGWPVERAFNRMREVEARWPQANFTLFLTHRMHTLTNDEISEKVAFWERSQMSRYQYVADQTGRPLRDVIVDMLRTQALYGLQGKYYLGYKGWELREADLERYVTKQSARALYSRLNERPELIDDKLEFSRRFGEFMFRRSWTNRGSSFESFLQFAEGLKQAFCKPADADQGRGVYVLDLPSSHHELREVYDDLVKRETTLLEQMIVQHPAVAAVYPGAVNTVRVLTVKVDDRVDIVAAVMRFGRHGRTDNFSIDGIVSDVDIDTGELITPGVDKKGTVHYRHPVTGRLFAGLQLPMWDQVKSLVSDAAAAAEGIGFVGWDVAICEDHVAIVEGNARPGTGLLQAPYAPQRFGRKYVLEPYVRMAAGEGLEQVVSTPDDFEFTPTNGGARLTRFRGHSRIVHVPAYALGAPVVEIGPDAFREATEVEQVRLPRTTRRVLRTAFKGCTSLTSVYLGNRLRVVGTDAFAGCASLSAVTLPYSLNLIRPGAFSDCASLTRIEVPPRITALERRAYAGCTNLEDIVLPVGLDQIEDEVFMGCSSLTNISQRKTAKKPLKNGTFRSVTRPGLPETLTKIGTLAFSRCASLRSVSIPYGVRRISNGAFANCTSLSSVSFHNWVSRIDANAFAGCTSLETLRIPMACKRISPSAFPKALVLRAPLKSAVEEFAHEHGYAFDPTAREARPRPNSRMEPAASAPASRMFYSKEQLASAIENFEIREPSAPVTEHPEPGKQPLVLEEGVYRRQPKTSNQARIMLVGDLMARASQIRAAHNGVRYDFDPAFRFVRGMFEDSDLVVGALETMLSPDYPYSNERDRVDMGGYWNAPPAFADSIRRAGIDAVATANNHVYDLGVKGIFDTLHSLNAARLVHTGLHASSAEERFALFEFDGIRISLHAFMDPSFSHEKKSNFTARGRRVLFSYAEPEEMTAQFQQATEMGADFSIAFCHWGNRNSGTVTSEQRDIASQLADSGADLIVGAHPHCLQPYEELQAADGRMVHCLWSVGNFVSDMRGSSVDLQDTLILELKLQRDAEAGGVRSTVRYHPCTILALGKDDYAVVPTSTTLEARPEQNRELMSSQFRTSSLMEEALYPAQKGLSGRRRVPPTIRRVDHFINSALDSFGHYEFPEYTRENFGRKRDLDPVVLSEAADRSGLETRVIAPDVHLYSSGEETLGFHMHMSSALSKLDRDATNNKFVTRAVLERAGLPMARGVLVKSPSQLRAAFRKIGVPLVIKPEAGSFGRGVRLSIETEEEMLEAALPILDSGENVIVEEMFLGIDLRIAVVNGEARAATFRVPANVIGDGRSTIAELVAAKNAVRENNDYISHQVIKFTPGIIEFLDKVGYSLDTVPARGKRVFLHHVANISAGGDSYEVINELHPDLKDLAVRTAALFPSALHSGIDVLVEHFDRGLDEQRAIICEVNLNNELPLHMLPVAGEPTPLADIELPIHWSKEARRVKSLSAAPAWATAVRSVSAQEVNTLLSAAAKNGSSRTEDISPASILRMESWHFAKAFEGILPGEAQARIGSDGFLYLGSQGSREVAELSGNRVLARAMSTSHAVRHGISAQLGVPQFGRFEFAGEIPEEARAALAAPGANWVFRAEARGLGRVQELVRSVEELEQLVGQFPEFAQISLHEDTDFARCSVLTRGTEFLASALIVPFGVRGDGSSTLRKLIERALTERSLNPQNQLRGTHLKTGDFLGAAVTDEDEVLAEGQWLPLSDSFRFSEGALSIGVEGAPWQELDDYSTAIADVAGNRGLMSTMFALRSNGAGLEWAWLGSRSEPRLVTYKYPHYGYSYDGFTAQAKFLLSLPRLSV